MYNYAYAEKPGDYTAFVCIVQPRKSKQTIQNVFEMKLFHSTQKGRQLFMHNKYSTLVQCGIHGR